MADYCLRCDGHHVINKKLSIIGHTSSAAWVAIMLFERYQNESISIFLNGEKESFDDETKALIKRYDFHVIEGSIEEIRGHAKEKKLSAFVVNNKIIETEICFIALGMTVYNDLAKMLGAELDQRGFVVTDQKGKSSIDGVYAAGDLRANTKKQIYTAWDTAVDSADDINVLIRRKKRTVDSLL